MIKSEQSAVTLVPFDLQTLNVKETEPLYPIIKTGGLVFPYAPTISESRAVNYSKTGDIVHSNEAYWTFQSAENVQISISNAVFTADTLENARYMMAAIHFFRTYTLMDFGSGRSGRPPSPMWLSAYGKYGFRKVPVLLKNVEIPWDTQDVDLVGVPNFENTGYGQASTTPANIGGRDVRIFQTMARSSDQQNQPTQAYTAEDFTWLPMKLSIPSIQLVVQHSAQYWKTFSLDDFRSGSMLSSRETPSSVGMSQSAKASIPSFGSTQFKNATTGADFSTIQGGVNSLTGRKIPDLKSLPTSVGSLAGFDPSSLIGA